MPLTLQYARKGPFPVCSICNEPVEIKTAKTDSKGQAVHEDCYVKMELKQVKSAQDSGSRP